jgi:hypothetical protein
MTGQKQFKLQTRFCFKLQVSCKLQLFLSPIPRAWALALALAPAGIWHLASGIWHLA